MNPLRRIAILGAESTGKSWLARTLTEVLSRRGQTVQWVPEVLRVLRRRCRSVVMVVGVRVGVMQRGVQRIVQVVHERGERQ